MILIRGDGVAARSCARLLETAGYSIAAECAERIRLSAVMLPATSQRLFEGVIARTAVFQGLPRMRTRVVKWGPDAAPAHFPHSATVVSERVLLEKIPFGPRSAGNPVWNVLSSPPFPGGATGHDFGSRTATVARVSLKKSCCHDACWIESLPDGWFFLIPDTETAWLISVGESIDSQLRQSTLVAPQIDRVMPGAAAFPAHPSIVWPMCGHNWLACGSAALRFDPLCGDGTGHAIREAILASAVVKAAARGEDIDGLLSHYGLRLLAGFRRHLIVCEQFYRTGGDGPWWATQLQALHRGREWCDRLLAGAIFRYRLNGLELELIR